MLDRYATSRPVANGARRPARDTWWHWERPQSRYHVGVMFSFHQSSRMPVAAPGCRLVSSGMASVGRHCAFGRLLSLRPPGGDSLQGPRRSHNRISGNPDSIEDGYPHVVGCVHGPIPRSAQPAAGSRWARALPASVSNCPPPPTNRSSPTARSARLCASSVHSSASTS